MNKFRILRVGERGGAPKEDFMHPLRPALRIVLSVATLVGPFGLAPTARAISNDYSINGTFAAVSDGQFATTDYAFHDEPTVRSTWSIQSTCTKDFTCTGQVSSDAGWTASLHSDQGRVWTVDRDIPGWQVCPDGTTSPGHQTFTFYPSDSNGVTKIGSPYLEGRDKTTGVSGACGTFKFLTIVMPFRLDRVG